MLLHHPHPSLPLLPPKTATFLIPSTSPSFFTFSTPSLLHLRRISTITSAAGGGDTQTLPQSAIQRIAEKLRSLGYIEEDNKKNHTPLTNPSSPGQIFIPLPTHLPKYRVGHTLDQSWSTPENPVPQPGLGNAIQRFHELKSKVEIEKKLSEKGKIKGKESPPAPTLAELTLPTAELRRLRNLGLKLEMKLKIKIGKAGITEGIVNGIHERWRRTELIRIKCDDICRLNMKRTHDLLEKKTGGLVIWRSGGNIIIYRGPNYKYPYFSTSVGPTKHEEIKTKVSSTNKLTNPQLIQGFSNRVRFELPGESQLAEETNNLLEGLGPRFNDWWGYEPLPIDGDLLPSVGPTFRRPFRLLPYGVNPKLTNDEMTILKRLGRPLPCHFVLGRNRNHQGLAAAIIKLWEKCEIAKIAVKRGVQNTNTELMAQELKRLTGGVLLSRDREFIVLYRGKDFLPGVVSSAIEEQRKRRINSENNTSSVTNITEYNTEYTEKYQDLTPGYISEDEKLLITNLNIKRTSSKLSMTLAKKIRAEKILADLEKEEITKELEIDKEGITEEERYMLRKIGLRMDPFLLLGRRGVFDGTIENMHLHWKYRELVKIITGYKNTEEVYNTAKMLERESGGILVTVERVSKGYAIIIYRGKNYERPVSIRPQTLLSKREAMKRSLEAQRRKSLKLHVLKLTEKIDDLKLQLAKTKDSEDIELAKDIKLGLVQEQDIENVESTENEIPDFTSVNNSEQAEESQVVDSTSQSIDDQIDALNNSSDEKVMEFNMNDQQTLPKIVPTRFTVSANMKVENCEGEIIEDDVEDTTSSDLKKTGGLLSLETSVGKNISSGTHKALHLSNKERLLLRKQALKTKKRPVLAVGKSNTVIGIAKTLKTHFEKHPLAIVNVKGRAKGTSVREVVFKLEQATGAVLVSQEPSKVILYRGYDVEKEEEQPKMKGSDRAWRKEKPKAEMMMCVSPELVSAIRIECGLLSNVEKEFVL